MKLRAGASRPQDGGRGRGDGGTWGPARGAARGPPAVLTPGLDALALFGYPGPEPAVQQDIIGPEGLGEAAAAPALEGGQALFQPAAHGARRHREARGDFVTPPVLSRL